MRQTRGSLIGWSIGIGVLVMITVASFPSFKGNTEFDKLWQELPEAARELFGGAQSISTFAGYMDSQILSVLPVLAGIFAMMQASQTLAGEEERGRMDLLLSTPLSRRQLVSASAVAILLTQFIFFLVIAVVAVISGLVIGETDGLWRLPLAVMDGLPAAWVFGMVTFVASAFAHCRSVAIMVGTIFLASSYFLGALAAQVDAIAPLRWGSITFHYGRSDWFGDGVDLVYIALSLGLCSLCYLISQWAFKRKDIT